MVKGHNNIHCLHYCNQGNQLGFARRSTKEREQSKTKEFNNPLQLLVLIMANKRNSQNSSQSKKELKNNNCKFLSFNYYSYTTQRKSHCLHSNSNCLKKELLCSFGKDNPVCSLLLYRYLVIIMHLNTNTKSLECFGKQLIQANISLYGFK